MTMVARAGRGGAAGAAATLLMSAFMFAVWDARMGRKPPEKVTGRLLRRAGLRSHGRRQDVTASAAHVAFGTAAGGAYALLPRVLPGALQGALFGTCVYAVSYWGWLPAAGLMPRPERDSDRRQAAMLAAHLVYGVSLGLLEANVVANSRLRNAMRASGGPARRDAGPP